jgi:hypothetical protein
MSIIYNQGLDNFISNGSRPSGHLNISTLANIVLDIINKQPLNEAEQNLLTILDPSGKGNYYQIAKKMKAKNFLSTYSYAICHKIPYAGIERCMLALANANPPKTDAAWTNLFNLVCGLNGVGYSGYATSTISSIQSDLSQKSSKPNAAAEFNSILNEFDKADDNLYLGFSQTNSSISDRIDKHYDVVTPGNNPVAATPRGGNLEDLLNKLETSLKLPTTKPVQVTTKGIKWEESSCVDGIGWLVVV